MVPPQGTEDWQRVSFQPMLYLATWIATWIIVFFGDFTNTGGLPDETASTFKIWITLGLVAPILGIGSLRMVTHGTGKWRYRGLWLRMAADLMQFTAMTLYLILRLVVGDYHVYPVACMGACLLFVFHLNLRDIKRLRELETLAEKIRRGEVGHAG